MIGWPCVASRVHKTSLALTRPTTLHWTDRTCLQSNTHCSLFNCKISRRNPTYYSTKLLTIQGFTVLFIMNCTSLAKYTSPFPSPTHTQHYGRLEWQSYLSGRLCSLECRHVATLISIDSAQDISWSSIAPSAWPASCSLPPACTPLPSPESVRR